MIFLWNLFYLFYYFSKLMTKKKNSKNMRKLIGTNVVPGTVVDAKNQHESSFDLVPRQVIELDLLENVAAKTIDRFYAGKNPSYVHDHFQAEMEKYELFGPAIDDDERCVWVSNLYIFSADTWIRAGSQCIMAI